MSNPVDTTKIFISSRKNGEEKSNGELTATKIALNELNELNDSRNNPVDNFVAGKKNKKERVPGKKIFNEEEKEEEKEEEFDNKVEILHRTIEEFRQTSSNKKLFLRIQKWFKEQRGFGKEAVTSKVENITNAHKIIPEEITSWQTVANFIEKKPDTLNLITKMKEFEDELQEIEENNQKIKKMKQEKKTQNKMTEGKPKLNRMIEEEPEINKKFALMQEETELMINKFELVKANLARFEKLSELITLFTIVPQTPDKGLIFNDMKKEMNAFFQKEKIECMSLLFEQQPLQEEKKTEETKTKTTSVDRDKEGITIVNTKLQECEKELNEIIIKEHPCSNKVEREEGTRIYHGQLKELNKIKRDLEATFSMQKYPITDETGLKYMELMESCFTKQQICYELISNNQQLDIELARIQVENYDWLIKEIEQRRLKQIYDDGGIDTRNFDYLKKKNDLFYESNIEEKERVIKNVEDIDELTLTEKDKQLIMEKIRNLYAQQKIEKDIQSKDEIEKELLEGRLCVNQYGQIILPLNSKLPGALFFGEHAQTGDGEYVYAKSNSGRQDKWAREKLEIYSEYKTVPKALMNKISLQTLQYIRERQKKLECQFRNFIEEVEIKILASEKYKTYTVCESQQKMPQGFSFFMMQSGNEFYISMPRLKMIFGEHKAMDIMTLAKGYGKAFEERIDVKYSKEPKPINNNPARVMPEPIPH